MSDRSTGVFTVLPADAEKAREILDPDETDKVTPDGFLGPVVEYTCNDVTGGGYDEAKALTEKGIPFFWTWDGNVGAYPGGQQVVIPSIGEAGAGEDGPTARVEDDGTFDKQSYDEALLFIRLYKQFQAMAGGEEPRPTRKFTVAMSRTGVSCLDIEVEAKSLGEAEEKALALAGDHVFSDHDAQYAVESVTEVK